MSTTYKVLIVVNFVLMVSVITWIVVQQGSVSRTGYIYNQKVFEAFTGTKELREKLNTVENANKQYLDSLNVLIQKGRVELQVVYDKKFQEFVSSRDQLSEQYTADIWRYINDEVSKYGQANNYSYIYGASGMGSLMYADSTNDITSEFIQYMNAKYSPVKK
jgi:outer membrane protein